MGRLADCLEKLGVKGAQAKFITDSTRPFTVRGVDEALAGQQALRSLIQEAREQRRSILEQLNAQLDEAGRTAVFAKQSAPKGEELPAEQGESASLVGTPVRPVPVSELTIDPDRFQFKGKTNDSGVVESEQLQGEYNPLAGGVILAWEDASGKKFVVNGHHRFDLAQRNGVDTVNAQVVREADGITAEAARALGAELNILEGQGSIDDYAQFFRETGISEQAAEQRGLLARAKGKTGFLVGKFAGDDTWAAYKSGKLTAEKAAVISDIGRDDPGFQAVGLDRARSLNVDQLASTLRALKLFPRNTAATQSDLFGFDDSAMVEAEAMGKAHEEIVRDLKDRVLAVRGALKRPAKAKEMGLSGDLAAIQAEVDRLTDEIDNWSKWTTDRELVKKVRERAGLATDNTQTADFQLSREGSPDASPVVAPYSVPEEDRLPPSTRGKERQGMLSTELEPGSLPGQQGLFEGGGMQGGSNRGPMLRPLPQSPAIEPKSQRQIIADLAKGLKVPIRFGRLTTNKFGGYFLPVQNLIAAARANDVPVISHEAGHKIDQLFGLSKVKSIADELSMLGDPDTPGSLSSWTKSKTLAYKRGEGVAEFVRRWLTDPDQARRMAPNTLAAFEQALDANKDLGDTLRQAQEDIRLWRTAEPQARLRSQISIGENPNKTRYTLSQATRDLVDDLHYLKLATNDAIKTTPGLPPSKQPYLLARNLRGSYGMAEVFVNKGVANFKTKAVTLGKSLEDALKPVGGRINDFRDWIVAKRAQELHKQGRETGLVREDVEFVAKKFDGDAEFQKAFEDVKEWNDSVLRYARDAGLLTKGSYAAIKEMNKDYVPFHRLFEVGADEPTSQETAGAGSGLNPGKPGSLKRLKGSTRNIVDPIETMTKNAYSIITASEKHAISLAVADMSKLPDMGKWVERVATPKEAVRVDIEKIKDQLEEAGADLSMLEDEETVLTFFRNASHPVFGENTIRVIREGKPEFYRLNRFLHDTFQALDLDDAGKLIRIFSAPAQVLRAGVVLEPSFNIANALRDTVGAAVLSKYGAVPFETTIRGVAAMVGNPKLVAEWAAAGGRSAVEASFFDRTKMQRYLAERISKDLTLKEQALIVATSPLRALRQLASVTEEATRIGEYQKAFNALTKSGMPEGEARRLAAFEARDRQDFAKGGAKTKILRHSAAFWNAALQANVRLVQAFKERPLQTTMAGIAFVTIPKLLEQALNWDDEDYWDRPQWERDAFFLLPIGKDDNGHTSFLRLPTPFEIGVLFGTVPGRFLAWAKENDPKAVEGLPETILKQSVPNPLPQTIQVIYEALLTGEQGWSVFRGRPIVPDSLDDLPVDLQWTEQTSRLAKAVGHTLGLSPMKIDYIIESTTGGLGKVFSGRQQPGKRFFTTPLAVSSQTIEDFYRIRDELRGESKRLKVTGESEGMGPVLLKEFEAVGEQVAAIRQKAKEADEAEAAKLQEEAYQLTKGLVERYRSNSAPEDATKEFATAFAKTASGSGKPKRKLGEPEGKYNERLRLWQERLDTAKKWLKDHKDSPAVQEAAKDVAADIPPYPRPNPGRKVDYRALRKSQAEWIRRYGDSQKILDELLK